MRTIFYRLHDVRTDLDDVLQSKQQLERVTLQMADDIRNLKMKVEQHSATFATVSTELKNKSKKLEEDNRLQVNESDILRKSYFPLSCVCFSVGNCFPNLCNLSIFDNFKNVMI